MTADDPKTPAIDPIDLPFTESEPDTSDIPEAGKEFFEKAELRAPPPVERDPPEPMAKPRFDTINPPISELAQRAVDAAKLATALPTFHLILDDGGMLELPRYRSHKIVGAIKVEAVDGTYYGCLITVSSPSGRRRIQLSGSFVTKHDPKPGGYLVAYDDGYISWTPAAPFEAGYTRIE